MAVAVMADGCRCLVERLAGQRFLLPEGGVGHGDGGVGRDSIEGALHYSSTSTAAKNTDELFYEWPRRVRVVTTQMGGSSQKPGAGMVGECIGVAHVEPTHVDRTCAADGTHLEN